LVLADASDAAAEEVPVVDKAEPTELADLMVARQALVDSLRAVAVKAPDKVAPLVKELRELWGAIGRLGGGAAPNAGGVSPAAGAGVANAGQAGTDEFSAARAVRAAGTASANRAADGSWQPSR
jgi:hypothetical protein